MNTILLIAYTFMPCAAMYIGLYLLKSAVWTFAIYHLLCILPLVLKKKEDWQQSLRWISLKEFLTLLVSSILFCIIALFTYEILGDRLLCHEDVLALLKNLGYSKQVFWPLSLYTIIVNPFVEELFWRGVVLKELDAKFSVRHKHFGIIWSSFSYALFHYLIFKLVLFFPFAEIGLVLLALYGAFLAFVYRKTASLVTTAFAHGMLTDTACIVLILQLFGRFPGIL